MTDPTTTQQSPSAVETPSSPATPHPVTVEVRVRLHALAVPEPGGGYSVIVPALPGCVTQGETIEDVHANVVEAAEGWLESQHDHRSTEALRMLLE